MRSWLRISKCLLGIGWSSIISSCCLFVCKSLTGLTAFNFCFGVYYHAWPKLLITCSSSTSFYSLMWGMRTLDKHLLLFLWYKDLLPLESNSQSFLCESWKSHESGLHHLLHSQPFFITIGRCWHWLSVAVAPCISICISLLTFTKSSVLMFLTSLHILRVAVDGMYACLGHSAVNILILEDTLLWSHISVV